MTMCGLFAVVLAGTVLGGPVTRALADTFSPVDFSSQANWTWSGTESPGHGQPLGVYLPGAPTGQTSLGGVPFDITSNAAGDQAWSGFIANTGSGSASITINVNTYGVTNVYTLINTIWGEDGGPYAALDFYRVGRRDIHEVFVLGRRYARLQPLQYRQYQRDDNDQRFLGLS